METGLADHVLPELPRLKLEIDEHHRHKDVYEHTLTVVEQAMDLEHDGPDLTLRLASLLHDIGKPAMTIWTSSAPSWAVFDPNIQRDEKQSPPPQ